MGVATFGRPNNLWMWYANQNVDVELVNVQVEEPAPNQTPQGVHRGINYNRNGVNIVLGFQNTRRRFAEPGFLAAVLGSLARYGSDIISSGFSFRDATSYPSSTHPNGKAFDTRYLSSLANQNRFVRAMIFYGINFHGRGNKGWLPNIVSSQYIADHESHLHSGGDDSYRNFIHDLFNP
jgi:hypothetical protein